MLRFIRTITAEFQAAFGPQESFVVTSSHGLSVLPMPIAKVKRSAPKADSDMYEIEVQKNKAGKAVSGTFGFHTATAIRQNEGSVPHLTEWDMDALKRGEKSLVGLQHTKAGRITNANNAKAKEAWHGGADASQIAKALNLSTSWAEKRHSAFEYALKQERGEL